VPGHDTLAILRQAGFVEQDIEEMMASGAAAS